MLYDCICVLLTNFFLSHRGFNIRVGRCDNINFEEGYEPRVFFNVLIHFFIIQSSSMWISSAYNDISSYVVGAHS